MDTRLLIAEIRKRPGIWNLRSAQYKDRIFTEKLWIQVARIMRVSVETCKRKWRNLRDAYRAEVRRSERRIKKDKLMGITYDKNRYKSKWAYFDDLDFMRSFKRRSCFDGDCESDNSNRDDFEYNYGEPDNDNSATFDSNFQHDIEIKIEPNDDDPLGDDSYKQDEGFKRQGFIIYDDDEMANEMKFEELENKIIQQEIGEQLHTKNIVRSHEPKRRSDVQNTNTTRHSILPANDVHCKSKQTTERHVHFSYDTVREAQKLRTSTKQQSMDSNNFKHIGDSDFNFLVSFLPHIKQMNTLQNLQFRAKMSEVVLNILAPTISGQTAQLLLTETSK